MKNLWLQENSLHALPTEIGRLASPKDLMLYSNHLKELPTEIGHLTSLETLWVPYLMITPCERRGWPTACGGV